MSFTTVALLVVGLITGTVMVHLFSSLRLKNLRTVPKPPVVDSETMKVFSAETRAGLSLHQACFNNDAKAASEALTMWAWAAGDSSVANSLDRKTVSLHSPDFRKAITELWSNLDSDNSKQWFGHRLWSAFLKSNPEFRELEWTG